MLINLPHKNYRQTFNLETIRQNQRKALQALCLSALSLPGMVSSAFADSDDEAGYQFGHYEEGVRDIYSAITSTVAGITSKSLIKIPNQMQPISVDSEHGFARFRLSDKIRFAVNYNQDIWSGASPISTAPASLGGNNPHYINGVISRASPSLKYYAIGNTSTITGFFNAQGAPLLETQANVKGAPLQFSTADRLQQTIGYASPEMRNQMDFKLGYDFDHAAVDLSAGASLERDYISRFANLGTRMEFNQKQTVLNLGLGYTNSDTHAVLDEGTSAHTSTAGYPGQFGNISDGQTSSLLVTGNRQDTAFNLGLSQILNKNSVLSGGFSYTNSNGYMSNAYKDVSVFLLKPDWQKSVGFLSVTDFPSINYASTGVSALEKRPELRNQFAWDGNYTHYIESLNAAAQLRYNFFHDDWGINAHTFDGEWRQSIASSWTLTPHVRYYSQTAADFFAPYIFSTDQTGQFKDLASRNFSSDQRLAAFGSLSGGVVLSKQIAEGLAFVLGFEYYTRASALQISGSGSGDYMNYHYFTGNAGIRANLSQLSHVSAAFDNSDNPLDWLNQLFTAPVNAQQADLSYARAYAPAGLQFSRMLSQAGQFTLGYRFLHDTQDGQLMQGDQAISITNKALLNAGCPIVSGSKFSSCSLSPSGISNNYHLLEMMYAPTSWLNLLLMPQFVSSSLTNNMIGDISRYYPHIETRNFAYGGGLGDTGLYAMFKLWDNADQHLHITQGFSAPTANIRNKSGITANYYPYNLQAGSGTWDYKPSVTYTGVNHDWFWGGQVNATVRMQKYNDLGYSLGDIFQTTAWGGYQFTRWLGATIRGVYTAQGDINGQHPLTDALSKTASKNIYYIGTNDSAQNYGGTFADVGFGLTIAMPNGRFAGNKLNFEWLQPVYTHFNGFQLDRSGALAASWSYGF